MNGRRFAYCGVLVGLSISVAANVMHARVDSRAPWWAPYLAAAWPLLLFLALEVLTRTVWADGRGVKVARAGVAVVASVAAALSYWHLRGLLVTAGEDAWAALLGPLAIDGLMAVSAAALLNGEADRSPVAEAEPAAPVAPAPAAGAELAPATVEPAPASVGADPAPPTEDLRAPALPAPDVEPPAEPLQVRRPVVAAATVAPPRLSSSARRPRGRTVVTKRTEADLRADLDAAISVGRLPAEPSAEAIRKHLRVGAATARALRDGLPSTSG